MSKIIKFTPFKITKLYMDRIREDVPADNDNKLMCKIIAEYYLMRYGQGERDRVRNQFIKDYFDD